MGSFLEACSKRFLPGTHWSQGCHASSRARVPSTVDATWSNSGKTICSTIESQYLWCLRASKFRHHLQTIFLQIKMLLIYIVLNILYNTLFTYTRCHFIHIPYEVNVALNPPIRKLLLHVLRQNGLSLYRTRMPWLFSRTMTKVVGTTS